MIIARILHIPLVFGAFFVALLVANRPRFWWQEVFHNISLYWSVPSLVAAIYLISRALRRQHVVLLSAAAGICYLYAGSSMLWRGVPYISYNGWSSTYDAEQRVIRGIWVDSWHESDDPQALVEQIERYRPEICLVSGIIKDSLVSAFSIDRYPYRVELGGVEGETILVVSAYRFGPEQHRSLGINARVGGLLQLQTAEAEFTELGVLKLVPSLSRESFERNRISSRRLSALVRNSSQPRIVVGDFSATPFSQLVTVYTEQARVRSLRFGSGFKELLRLSMYKNYHAPTQVFVSKEVSRRVFEEFALAGRDRPGIFFEVGLPGAELK